MIIKRTLAVLFAALLLTGAGCKSNAPEPANTQNTTAPTDMNTNTDTMADTSADAGSNMGDEAQPDFHGLSLPYDQSAVTGPVTSDGIEYYSYTEDSTTLDDAETQVRTNLAYSDWTTDTDEATDTGWHFLLYRGDEKMVVDLDDTTTTDGIDVLMGYTAY